jgi:hypothetical protein
MGPRLFDRRGSLLDRRASAFDLSLARAGWAYRAIDTSHNPAHFDYAPEGLTYDLDIPLRSIAG